MIDADLAVDLQKLLATVRSTGVEIEEARLSGEGNDVFIRLAIRPVGRVAPAEVAGLIARTEHVKNVEWSK